MSDQVLWDRVAPVYEDEVFDVYNLWSGNRDRIHRSLPDPKSGSSIAAKERKERRDKGKRQPITSPGVYLRSEFQVLPSLRSFAAELLFSG